MIRTLRALLVSLSLSALAVSAAQAGPIHDAVRQGDVAAIEAAIASGADLEAEDEAMLTPLVIAALEGREDVVALLIAGGADPAGRDGNGLTALHAGAHVGALEVVRTLLASGLDPNDRANRFGITPLHAAAERGFVEIAALLIENGADLELPAGTGHTALFMAMLNTHAEMASLLKAKGADCGHIRSKRYRAHCDAIGK